MTPTNSSEVFQEPEVGFQQILPGSVSEVREDGTISVNHPGDDRPLLCRVLESTGGPAMQLAVGDAVLLWRDPSGEGPGVILGRIGSIQPSSRESPEKVPDTLVIAARKNLILQCGEGSITLREDGKILIKGKDLVAHALRMNRIRGGSVSIN